MFKAKQEFKHVLLMKEKFGEWKKGVSRFKWTFTLRVENFEVFHFFLCKFWGSNVVEIGHFKVIRKVLKNVLLKWGLVFKTKTYNASYSQLKDQKS